ARGRAALRRAGVRSARGRGGARGAGRYGQIEAPPGAPGARGEAAMPDAWRRQVVERAVDESLARAMRAEPSSAFLARVRSRVASERAQAAARRRRAWLAVAAGVGVAAAVALVAPAL